MPANTKYLSSTGQRWLKVTAGILGGYIVAIFVHNAIGAVLVNKDPLILTSAYSSFFLWVGFMIYAFLSKNGWKTWGICLLIIALCITTIVLFK